MEEDWHKKFQYYDSLILLQYYLEVNSAFYIINLHLKAFRYNSSIVPYRCKLLVFSIKFSSSLMMLGTFGRILIVYFKYYSSSVMEVK